MKLVITAKGAFIRNLAAALVNGTITLILLLIAPLGLAAVIFNTILVTLSTFMVNSLGDRVVQWLLDSGKASGQFPESSRPVVNDWPRLPARDAPPRQDGDRTSPR